MTIRKANSACPLRVPRRLLRGKNIVGHCFLTTAWPLNVDMHLAAHAYHLATNRIRTMAQAYNVNEAANRGDLFFKLLSITVGQCPDRIIHDRCIQYPCRSMSIVTPIATLLFGAGQLGQTRRTPKFSGRRQPPCDDTSRMK
jgi:hypothetical protein